MKKIIALTFVLILALSLVACGRATDNMTSDAESIGDAVVSGAESIVDDAESTIKDDDKKTNFMAGITANEALDTALSHAKLDKSQVSDIDVDLDRDNGSLIYEVDFNSGNTEYDYDIDADTGEVISANKSKE